MEDFLSDFRKTIDTASESLLQVSEAQSERPRIAGKWSPKEIIGHLIDSAANNHQRFVRAQFTDDLVFEGYDQEEWVRVQHYSQESWIQLVRLWQHYNLHLLHFMTFTPTEPLRKLRARHSLSRIAWQEVNENEAVTLEGFMRDYVEHLKNHLRQILTVSEL